MTSNQQKSNYSYLIWQMAKREVLGRYRGSIMGIVWSFLTPLIMLVVYTFVFSYVFKARWGGGSSTSHVAFSIYLFAGIIVYNFFSEVITRSPTIILSQVNYVKKVVFPLQILPLSCLLGAIFHLLISLFVFLLFLFLVLHSIPWTAFLFPIVVFPLLLMVLGLSWFLSALGVYLRDMNYVINLIMTVCMFFSPLFYPIDTLPEAFRVGIYLNPISFMIDQSRAVLVDGKGPDVMLWLVYFGLSLVVLIMGYGFFQKTKKGFSDVI